MFGAMTNPQTGQPYDFGSNAGQWVTGPSQAQQGGVDMAPTMVSPGMNGISPDVFNYLGLTPDKIQQAQWGQDKENYDPSASIRDLFNQTLAAKGLHLGEQSGAGVNQTYQQLFDASNNPVGPQAVANQEQDPGGLFAAGVLGMGAFGAGAALGAFGGAAGGGGASAGAAGVPEGAGGLAGTGLPEYAGYAGGTPYGLAGDVAAAPEGAFAGGGGGLSSADAAALYGPEGYGAGATPAEMAAGGGGLMNSIGSGLGDVSSWMKANPGLTNVGGGLLNGLIGAYQSNKAIGAQKDATNAANAMWAPYREAGTNALGRLNGLMSNPGSITSDPGYQFGLSQGVQGVDRSAASKGGLYSGATLKALDRYGQDYGGTKLNDAYARYGNIAQLGAQGTTNMSNNLTNLGNAQAGQGMYMGNVLQNGVNNALGQFNFSNGGYGAQNPFNMSTYPRSTIPPGG